MHWRSPLGKDTKVTARRRLWGTPHEGFVRGLSGGIKAGCYESSGLLKTSYFPRRPVVYYSFENFLFS